MNNVYILGGSKFIKESIKGFDPQEFSISSTDNPDLFKIQLSKEKNPNSIILVDNKMLPKKDFLSKVFPFLNKKTLDLDFIKENPLFEKDLNSVNVEKYSQIKDLIKREDKEEQKEEDKEKDKTEQMETIEEETDEVVEEIEGIEEEYDLETLLENGLGGIESNNVEDEEDFDLEELIAQEVGISNNETTTEEKDDDEDFDLDELIAQETSKNNETPVEEIEGIEDMSTDEEEFDIDELIAQENSNAKPEEDTSIKEEEKNLDDREISDNDDEKPTKPEENDLKVSINKKTNQEAVPESLDPKIMMPNECTYQIGELIKQLLNGEIIDININISSSKNNKKAEIKKEDLAHTIGAKKSDNFDSQIDIQKQITEMEKQIDIKMKNEKVTQEDNNVLQEEKNDETTNPINKNTKTVAQNMMEHFSEDEIVQMVIDGKL